MSSNVCSVCKSDKPLEMFHKDKSKLLGVCSACKECAVARTRAHMTTNSSLIKEKKAAAYKADPDKEKARVKKWNAENKDKVSARNRAARLRNKYGITQKEYEELGEAQQWKCAICGSKDSGSKNSDNLSVDHCHDTGRIRGLLCHPCNAGIGYLKESEEIMNKAINYLKEVRA
jgi:hypothetical protein